MAKAGKICGSMGSMGSRASKCSADCAKDGTIMCASGPNEVPCASLAKDGGGVGTRASERVAKTDIFCSILNKVREPLASYQERSGLPRDMDHSFVGLLTALVQTGYNAVLTVCTMLFNLIPLAECILYLFRFILDKCLNICHTEDFKEKIFKIVLFIGELCIISLIMMIIYCWIIVPIWQLISYIAMKVWHTVYSAK